MTAAAAVARLQRRAGDVVHRLQPAVRPLWRRAVLWSGTDVTDRVAGRSCLVLAPHPDDETLGCGATIARKRAAGTPVRVVVAADGRYAQKASRVVSPDELRRLRAAEVVEACGVLGVAPDDVLQLGHEDTRLEHDADRVVDELCEVLAAFRPEEVLVTSARDHHPDHRTLNRCLHRALARTGQRCRVGEYPVWYWIDGPWRELSARSRAARTWHLVAEPVRSAVADRPRLVATAGFLDVKSRALRAHRSQMSNLTGEAVWGVMEGPLLDPFLLSHEVFLRAER